MSLFAGAINYKETMTDDVIARLYGMASWQSGSDKKRYRAPNCSFLASALNVSCAPIQDNWVAVIGRLDDCARDSYPDRIWWLYEKWGDRFPQHAWGDFLVILWDNTRQKLLVVCDTVGSYPFYYAVVEHCTYFSSDPRRLLTLPGLEADYDPKYLTTYMVMAGVNGEHTPFKAIRQVPYGHTLSVEKTGIACERWWHLPKAGSLQHKKTGDYEEQLRHLLQEAVRVRLASQRAVTITLSRGVDSSAIAAMSLYLLRTGQVNCPDVQCVTFHHPRHPEANESDDAVKIAGHLGVPCYRIEPDEDFLDLDLLLDVLPEPNGIVTHWYSWKSALSFCRVNNSDTLLTGLGGELNQCPLFYLADMAREKQWLGLLLELFRWKKAGISFTNGIKATLLGIREPVFNWRPVHKLHHYPWLLFPEECESRFESLSRSHVIEQDTVHTFSEKLNPIAAMNYLAHNSGVDIRHPLTDRRLVEFFAAIPLEFRLWRQMPEGYLLNKPLLRAAVQWEVPFDLTKSNKPLRAELGSQFNEQYQKTQYLLNNPPPKFEDIVDLGVLRQQLIQLQQDRGEKRYVALTSLLVRWLARSNEPTNIAVRNQFA